MREAPNHFRDILLSDVFILVLYECSNLFFFFFFKRIFLVAHVLVDPGIIF